MATAVYTVALVAMVTVSQMNGVCSFSVSVKDSKTWVCGCLGEQVRMTVLYEPPDEALIVVRWFQDPGASEQRVYSYIPSLNKSDTSGPMNGRVSLEHVSTTSPHGSVTLVIHRLYENDTVKSGSTYIQYRCEVQDSNNNQHTAFFNLTRRAEPKCSVRNIECMDEVHMDADTEYTHVGDIRLSRYFDANGEGSVQISDNSSRVNLDVGPKNSTPSVAGTCMRDAVIPIRVQTETPDTTRGTERVNATAVVTQGGIRSSHTCNLVIITPTVTEPPSTVLPTEPPGTVLPTEPSGTELSTEPPSTVLPTEHPEKTSCKCTYSQKGVTANAILIAILFVCGLVTAVLRFLVYLKNKKDNDKGKKATSVADKWTNPACIALATVCFLLAVIDIIVMAVMINKTCEQKVCAAFVTWETGLLVIACLLCVLAILLSGWMWRTWIKCQNVASITHEERAPTDGNQMSRGNESKTKTAGAPENESKTKKQTPSTA